jgi:hypothetical protein
MESTLYVERAAKAFSSSTGWLMTTHDESLSAKASNPVLQILPMESAVQVGGYEILYLTRAVLQDM